MHKNNLKTSPSIDIIGSKTLISCYLVKLFFARLVFISFLVFSLIVHSIDVEAKGLRKADIVEKSLLNSNRLGLVAGLNDDAATKDINISAVDGVSIIASADTFRSNSKSETKTASVSYGGSVGASIGFQEAENSARSTTYNNSLISAEGGNLNVTSGGDTKLSGANLEATDTALTVGGDLTVESLQNDSHSRSKSKGATVGFSSGGANVGFNFAKGNSDRTWVDDITSITGSNSVTINTAGNTHIKGAKIANENAAGEDLGNLTLATNSLTFEDIKNSDESRNRGGGFSISGLGGKGDTTDSSQANPTATRNKAPKGSTTISLVNESRWKEGNTKATIGDGNITIGGETATAEQLLGLNRDSNKTEEITRDIIDGALNASVTIDNRLLTKEGRASIKKDFKNLPKNTVQIGKELARPDRIVTGGTKFVGNSLGLESVVRVTEKVEDKIDATLNSLVDGSDKTIGEKYSTYRRARGDVGEVREDKGATEVLNNATDYDAAENKKAYQDATDILQKDNPNGEVAVNVYSDADDLGGGRRAYYDNKGKEVYVNTGTLDISDEKDNVKAIFQENERASRDSGGVTDRGINGKPTDAEDQQVHDYSDRASFVWNRSNQIEGSRTGGSGTSIEDWRNNNANSSTILSGNARNSKVDEGNKENYGKFLLQGVVSGTVATGKHLAKKEVKKKATQKIAEQAVKAAATSALNQEEAPTPEVEGAEGEEVETNAKDNAEEESQIVSTSGGGDKEPDEEDKKKKEVIQKVVKKSFDIQFNNDKKLKKQMRKRGWTYEQIKEALNTKGVPAQGKKNAATRYIHPKTGKSVVVDNKTGEIFHIGKDGFGY